LICKKATPNRQQTDNGTHQNHSEPNTMCWLTKRGPQGPISTQNEQDNFDRVFNKSISDNITKTEDLNNFKQGNRNIRTTHWQSPHDAITWKTSYVAIPSRRGGRGKLVTSIPSRLGIR
jgi:hypothetical protein